MTKEKEITIKVNDNSKIYIQKNSDVCDWKITGIANKGNSFVETGQSTTPQKALRDAKMALARQVPIKNFKSIDDFKIN